MKTVLTELNNMMKNLEKIGSSNGGQKIKIPKPKPKKQGA